MFYSLILLTVLAASSIESASVSNARNFFAHYSKPYGYGVGTLFGGALPLDDKTRITKVLVHANQFIVSLQFQLIDSTGVVTLTQNYGGMAGPTLEFNVPNGEYITQVEINSGTLIDGLTFITNKGTRSQKFGGSGGGQETIDLEGQLIAVQGRTEFVWINQIQFISKQIVE